MGFEVIYHFHERQENGKYNTEEKKEMKKKIGSPFEDLPLEQLAAVVMSQLARRDIWVVDVEIYEYTKKKLSFKESTDGGILIKNKKFCLDKCGANLISQEVYQEECNGNGNGHHSVMIDQPPEPNVNLAPLVNNRQLQHLPPNEMANRASNMGRVKTWMVFDPEIPLVVEARNKGLRFTVNKKYPIYQLSEHPMGLSYGNVITTVDDTGKQVTVSDKYFVPANINLVGDREVPGGFNTARGRPNNEPKLAFQGEVDDEVPVLRPNAGVI
jgi:hypothetical protein